MKTLHRPLFLCLLMLLAFVLAKELKPQHKIADQMLRFNLEAAIPDHFGDWQLDLHALSIVVTPDVQAMLNTLYDQTLTRTYTNNKGQRVMLSIAYGGDQSSDKTQVHRPEFCYSAQGFQLSRSVDGQLAVGPQMLKVRRLTAVQGARNEPITYWITVGDQVTLPGIGRKILQLKYGLTGEIPDGILVRVSTIDENDANAFALQDKFIEQMLLTVKPEDRLRLAGKFSSLN